MAEHIDSQSSTGCEDGPAKNLRKNSGRSIPIDNMVSLGDKLKTRSEVKKKKARETTPSVKEYFKQHSSDTERDEEDEWGTTHGPTEDWTDVEGTVKTQTQVRTRNRSRSSNTSYDSCESDTEDIDSDFKPLEEGNIKSTGIDLDAMIIATHNMVKELKRSNEARDTRVHKHENRLQKLEDKVKMLTQVVIQQDRVIQRLNSKQTTMEKNRMKPEIIITGLPEQKGENCAEAVKTFLKEQMTIKEEIKVKEAHRIGKYNSDYNRIVRVRCADMTVKIAIMKHAKNLKGKKNKDNESYFVNDNLPEELSEVQRKLQMKVKFNNSLIDAQKQSLQWKRGELIIDGHKYEPKVNEPSHEQMLSMTTEQIKKILACKVYQDGEATKNGSKFLGICC